MFKRFIQTIFITLALLCPALKAEALTLDYDMLHDVVASMSEMMPVDIGNGLSMIATDIDDDNQMVNFYFKIGEEMGLTANDIKTYITAETFVTMLKSDENMKEFLDALKPLGYGVRFLFTDFDYDTAVLQANPSQL